MPPGQHRHRLDRPEGPSYLYVLAEYHPAAKCTEWPIDTIVYQRNHTNDPLAFDRQFTAKVGGSTPVDESRKNCQINLKLQYEPGFSFSVYQADYTGWADLDDGVKGTVKATYYVSGQAEQVRYIAFTNACKTSPDANTINSAPQLSLSTAPSTANTTSKITSIWLSGHHAVQAKLCSTSILKSP